MKKMICLLVCLFVGSANAGLIGNDVLLEYLFPDTSTIYGSATATVGAGTEFTNFVNHFDLDVDDTNITVNPFSFSSSFSTFSFNGWVLSDLNGTIDDIVNVTINSATNMIGLDSSRLTFDSNSIGINWQGLSFTTNTIVSLDVEFDSVPVPEPLSIALLGLGLAGIGFSRKNKNS